MVIRVIAPLLPDGQITRVAGLPPQLYVPGPFCREARSVKTRSKAEAWECIVPPKEHLSGEWCYAKNGSIKQK